jgi:serine/tyrosine/threonine adenylyltransferase
MTGPARLGPHCSLAYPADIQYSMSSSDASAIASPAASDQGAKPVRFDFENTYARLPERFYARVDTTPVAAPRLVKVNADLARSLGLDPDALASPQGVEILAGNRVAEGSEPLAQAYAGHQFGHFVPQLGDGRANLLGEVVGRDGVRYDIQLKGSGPTPFSRRGDGRAALGPVLREYIVSEAMAALGVPTTRALAAVTTGQQVVRETILPGAVLTRVAASHLRVGTFQYFAAKGDTEAVRMLADFTIARHYPEATQAKLPYRALLDGVIGRQAHLVAQWLLLGFIHGVMNTDNTSISGETIDYGPCAFMEAYDPDKVFSSIDINGRYAYSNQPAIALWNLTRLAEALLPVLEQEEGSAEAALASAKAALAVFQPQFEAARMAGLRRKLGLLTEREGDAALAEDLLERMAANRADFTLTFRRLSDAAAGPEGDGGVRALFANPAAYDSWAAGWRRRLEEEPASGHARAVVMRGASPAFIPRNHIVQAALDAAIGQQDLQPFEELLDVVSRPYEDRPALERYTTPARPEQCVTATFCGT